jgi:hypothetical protein
MKELCPTPDFTITQPKLNLNDVTHDETNALYAGNQEVALYSTPPPPIPYTGQSPHPMANTFTTQYHESMVYAGGFRGRCNKCGMYGHKILVVTYQEVPLLRNLVCWYVGMLVCW